MPHIQHRNCTVSLGGPDSGANDVERSRQTLVPVLKSFLRRALPRITARVALMGREPKTLPSWGCADPESIRSPPRDRRAELPASRPA